MAGNASPVAVASWLRRSTAVSESKPRSRNARSTSTAAAPAWPSTTATFSRTRSSTSAVRSSAGLPSSASRSSWSPGPVASPVVGGATAASGSPASSGLGRDSVKTGANCSHTTSTTATCVPSATARLSSPSARSGAMAGSPESRRCRTRPLSSGAPRSSAPQEIAVVPRRRVARASR